MTHLRPRPPGSRFENGGRFASGGPPSPYPTVKDIQVIPWPSELGVSMQWISDGLGLVTTFPWWDDVPSRLGNSAWRPVGSKAKPFRDLEPGWEVEIWSDGEFVYVHQGEDRGFTTWFRVPADVFEAAWSSGAAAIRNAVASPPTTPRTRRKRRVKA